MTPVTTDVVTTVTTRGTCDPSLSRLQLAILRFIAARRIAGCGEIAADAFGLDCRDSREQCRAVLGTLQRLALIERRSDCVNNRYSATPTGRCLVETLKGKP